MKNFILLLAAIAAFADGPPVVDANKVIALLGRQDFKAALERAAALNRRRPDDVDGYQLLAASYLGLGDYSEAEKAVQWMLDLRIGKADTEGWMMVAHFREVTGDIDGANDAVNFAFSRLSPAAGQERRALLVYSAHLQQVGGKLNNADRLLSAALAEDPADESAGEVLAGIRIAQHRRPDAIQILRRIARPEANPRLLYGLAEATGDSGDYAAFERAARARISSPDNANRELALYYAGIGKRPDEAERIARLEAGRRHDVFTMDALSMALQAAGKPSEARAAMTGVLAVGTRDPEILAHAAEIGVKTE
jgi:predicted Zn-dependent protease